MLKTTSGQNYTAAEAGKFSDLLEQHGKLFLKNQLNLTGMEVSLNQLLAGQEAPFYHSHKEDEELYIFIKGNGQFQVDDQTIDVTEGTVIRVDPAGKRAWRNNSQEDLYFICIQTKQDSLHQWTMEDGSIIRDPLKWPE